MQRQCDIRRQHHVGKVRRHGGALHIAEEMEIDGRVHGLGKRADGAPQFAEIRVAVAGLNALKRRAQLRVIGNRLRQQLEAGRPAP